MTIAPEVPHHQNMSDKVHQGIAVGLIFFAAVCIGIGSHYGWRDLVNFAMTFGGGGVGILTGQQISKANMPNLTNTEGGTINVTNPTEPAA